MRRKRPAAASYLDALLLSSSVARTSCPHRRNTMQAREGLSQGVRDRENSTPRKRENVVVAFNALLTSLDAKLPTSRFTADELRISNGRRRRSRCKLHSLSHVAARSSFLAEAACIRISLVRGNGHRKPRRKCGS